MVPYYNADILNLIAFDTRYARCIISAAQTLPAFTDESGSHSCGKLSH
jgi:hypothetical protein